MSARKSKAAATRPYDEYRGAVAPSRPRKKPRRPRVRLTHFEVRRGESLRLRVAVADDAVAEVGDELGALIRKVAPSAQTIAVDPEPEFVVSRLHADDDDDYHASLREHLAALFGSLCDAALADALEIAREERARRAEGGN